jgi:hypothetical protein
MAILQGFPPSNTISPSVRIAEKDLSFVPSEQRFNRAGLIGFATKGPINTATLVTSTRNLHQLFGFPDPTISAPYLIYAAEQYLAVASSVWIVRVADIDVASDEAAQTASIEIPSAGTAVAIEGNGVTPFSFGDMDGDSVVDDRMFRWRLNGVLSQKTLVVLANTNRPSPDTGVAYTPTTLVADLNAQLTVDDGILFYVVGTTKIGVKSTFSYGTSSTLELVSCRHSLYGPAITVTTGSGVRVMTAPATGLGTGMLPAQVVGSLDRFPNNSYQTAGNYDFSGGEVNLQIVVDGTDNANIDNIAQVVVIPAGTYTTLTLVTAINAYIVANLTGGFRAYKTGNNVAITTEHTGRDARLLVKSASTASAALGLSSVTVTGSGATGVTGDATTYADAIVSGGAGAGDTLFTVYADSPGTSGNNTQLVIKNNVRDGNFTMEVYSGGVQVEAWGGLVRTETARLYVESFLALSSYYVRVTDIPSVLGLPAAGTYALTGGTDGIPADPDEQDLLMIGNDVAMTGMQAFSEPEQIDIDLVAIPGFSSTSAITALLAMCAARADCLAIVDAPFGFTVNEVVAWQNGVHTLNSSKFDSDFGALYWPWVKVRDTTNRIDVWVPPSGSVLAAFVKNDDLGAPWMAPAGTTRGIVPNILDVYSKPSLTERDLMYGYRNAVNPIISFTGTEGFMIWGQKTLQRLPTALDRVSVRRLMFYLEKRVRQECRGLLFEPHDAKLRSRFVDVSTRILSNVQVLRGLNDFKVQCDEELNPADVVDRNELRARIGVQPIRAAEFIFVEFSIHRTGSFTENADTF